MNTLGMNRSEQRLVQSMEGATTEDKNLFIMLDMNYVSSGFLECIKIRLKLISVHQKCKDFAILWKGVTEIKVNKKFVY